MEGRGHAKSEILPLLLHGINTNQRQAEQRSLEQRPSNDEQVKVPQKVPNRSTSHKSPLVSSTSFMSTIPLSTSDVKQEVAIRKGDGDFYNLPALTVMECFDATVKKYGDKPALHQKIPVKVSLLDRIPVVSHQCLSSVKTKVRLFIPPNAN